MARQYTGTVGKVTNCQIAVSVHAVTDTCSAPPWIGGNPAAKMHPACGSWRRRPDERLTAPRLFGATNIAAALRHHARDTSRPLATYAIM